MKLIDLKITGLHPGGVPGYVITLEAADVTPVQRAALEQFLNVLDEPKQGVTISGACQRCAINDGSPVDVSETQQRWYDEGCRCFMHKCGCTTGWQPDEACGCGVKP